MPLTVPRLSSGSQVIWQLVCSLQAVVTGYFQRYSWCVFLVVGVVVVDFIAEDKCVPAHLVSPNFSSSSLDSQQPQPSTVKEHHDHFFLLLFSFPSLNKWLCVPHQLHSEWCWTVGLCSGMVLSLLKSLQCQFQNVILVLLKIPGHASQIVLTRKSNTSQHWSLLSTVSFIFSSAQNGYLTKSRCGSAMILPHPCLSGTLKLRFSACI